MGKALMLEGLQRLRHMGARSACVTTVHDNQGARSLYQAAGFGPVNTERLYGRNL